MTLETQLSTLAHADLIRLAQTEPELEYLFRHVLVQEVAYRSLLKHNRRALHLVVGEVLERAYADRLDEHAPLLAHHFAESEDHARALKYFIRAGDHATRQYANAEAVLHYDRALDLLRDASGAHLTEMQRVQLARGRVLEVMGRYADALAGYRELEAAGRARGARSVELAAQIAQATLLTTPNPVYDPPQARALLQRLLPIAGELGDRAAEARILWNLMLTNIYSGGDMGDVLAWGERAIAITIELGMFELRAYILHDIFFAYQHFGQLERVYAVLAEASDLWRKLNNMPMLAETLVFQTNMLLLEGRYDEALTVSEQARQVGIAGRHLFSEAYSRVLVGRVYLDRGKPARAIAFMEDAIRQGDESGNPGVMMFTRVDLGMAYGWSGAIETGIVRVERARRLMEERVPHLAVWPLAILARLHLLTGDLDSAQPFVEQAWVPSRTITGIRKRLGAYPPAWSDIILSGMEYRLARRDYIGVESLGADFIAQLRRLGMRCSLPDALHVIGRALLAQERTPEAQAALSEARAEAEAIGSKRLMWQILATLGELEARQGNTDAASALCRQARELIADIADQTASELRASFLSLPHVRAVMEMVSR